MPPPSSRSFTRVPSLRDPLKRQIESIAAQFPAISGVSALYLFGSCARDEATYRSDVDLLTIHDREPNIALVAEVRNLVEEAFLERGQFEALEKPLPVQIQIVSNESRDRFLSKIGPHILLRDFGHETRRSR